MTEYTTSLLNIDNVSSSYYYILHLLKNQFYTYKPLFLLQRTTATNVEYVNSHVELTNGWNTVLDTQISEWSDDGAKWLYDVSPFLIYPDDVFGFSANEYGGIRGILFSRLTFDYDIVLPSGTKATVGIKDTKGNVLWSRNYSDTGTGSVIINEVNGYQLYVQINDSFESSNGDGYKFEISNILARTLVGNWNNYTEDYILPSSFIDFGANLWKFYIERNDGTKTLTINFREPTKLSAGINDIVESIPVDSTISYPSEGEILIDSENIYYQNKTTTSLTNCIRGWENTTPVSHLIGSEINIENRSEQGWFWEYKSGDSMFSQHHKKLNFYSIKFDYEMLAHSDIFIGELLDDDNNVIWSESAIGTWSVHSGSIELVEVSESFNFRIRCIADDYSAANLLYQDLDAVETIVYVYQDTITPTPDYPSWGIVEIESEQIKYTGFSYHGTFGTPPDEVYVWKLTGCERGWNGTTATSHIAASSLPVSTLYNDSCTYLQLSNLEIERYADEGIIEGTFTIPIFNTRRLMSCGVKTIEDITKEKIKMMLKFSINGSTFGNYCGIDGDEYSLYSNSSYSNIPSVMSYDPNYFSQGVDPESTAFTNYLKFKIILQSNGYGSPEYHGFVIDLINYIRDTIYIDITKCDASGTGGPSQWNTEIPLSDFSWIKLHTTLLSNMVALSLTDDSLDSWYTRDRDLNTILILIIKSWIESVSGKVMSGYCKDQYGNIITNNEGGIITLTYGSSYDPNDVSAKMASNGLYQAFMKGDTYDDWHLIFVDTDANQIDIAYRKYPESDTIDPVPDVKDLQFWVIPNNKICAKAFAHVGSAVSY